MCAWRKNVLFHAPAQKRIRIPRLVFPDLVTTIQPGAGKPFDLVKFSMVYMVDISNSMGKHQLAGRNLVMMTYDDYGNVAIFKQL